MKPLFTIAIILLSFAAYVAIKESSKQRKTQEKVVSNIESDSAYSVEWIHTTPDSLYLFKGRQLVKVIGIQKH